MTAPLHTRCFLPVDADSDPTVASRILHLLTQRGDIPDWFSVRRNGAGTLRIAVECGGLDEESAHFLAQKIRRLPTVVDVTRAWLSRRDPLRP